MALEVKCDRCEIDVLEESTMFVYQMTLCPECYAEVDCGY